MSPNQQRRPLHFLLSLSFFYDFNVQTLEIENMLNLFQIIKKKFKHCFFLNVKSVNTCYNYNYNLICKWMMNDIELWMKFDDFKCDDEWIMMILNICWWWIYNEDEFMMMMIVWWCWCSHVWWLWTYTDDEYRIHIMIHSFKKTLLNK